MRSRTDGCVLLHHKIDKDRDGLLQLRANLFHSESPLVCFKSGTERVLLKERRSNSRELHGLSSLSSRHCHIAQRLTDRAASPQVSDAPRRGAWSTGGRVSRVATENDEFRDRIIGWWRRRPAAVHLDLYGSLDTQEQL